MTFIDSEIQESQALGPKSYLMFQCGLETFATPLNDVKEVAEVRPICALPGTIQCLKGVANLGGSVVAVLDLALRLGLQPGDQSRQVFLVYDDLGGPLAAQVDCIFGVAEIDSKNIETNINLISSIPKQYISGVARFRESLCVIVNLKKLLLDTEELQVEFLALNKNKVS